MIYKVFIFSKCFRYKNIFTFAIAILIVIFALSEPLNASGISYVVNPITSKRESIPITYEYQYSIFNFGKFGMLNGAEDIFLTEDNMLYIADTGNNRILKYNITEKKVKEFTDYNGITFRSPEGVFVDELGNIFVADTGNERVVHLNPQGEFIEWFEKPESELLGPDFRFNPRKVILSPTGILYTIKDQSILQVDANNQFRGFLGSIRVEFSIRNLFIRLFATDEQKRRLGRTEPPSYLNFTLGEDGFLYATSLDSNTGQIKKLNSIGRNIYPEAYYGEIAYDENQLQLQPRFSGIAVDHNGIVYVVESNSGKIYQYSRDGSMLAVFGGKGNKKGMFTFPNDIVVDSKGTIYINDYGLNNIHVFKPTQFMSNIHLAISAYQDGEYEKAESLWNVVLETCEIYHIAFEQKGMIEYKSNNYLTAMETYHLALNKQGYSKAFTKYRHNIIRENFAVFTLTLITLILLTWFIIKKYKKFSHLNIEKLSIGGKRL